MEEVIPPEDAQNPLEGSELVVYSAPFEWADEEPVNEQLKNLGVVSWSLWARWEDEGVEIPLAGQSAWTNWFSLSTDEFSPDPAEPVSEAFKDVICGVGWSKETWDEMGDLEQYICSEVLFGFAEMDTEMPAVVIDYIRGGD